MKIVFTTLTLLALTPVLRADPGALPGVVGMDHIGISVLDSDAAVSFFTEVIGCRAGLRFGPLSDPESDSMHRRLNVHPRTVIRQITLLECGANAAIELLEYDSPDQSSERPRNSDAGGHHIAFRVQDIDRAAAWLREQGYVTFEGPVTMQDGPAAGLSILYFESPWGLQLELVAEAAEEQQAESTNQQGESLHGRDADVLR